MKHCWENVLNPVFGNSVEPTQKQKFAITEQFRVDNTENPIQNTNMELLKIQDQRNRWRLSLLGVLDLRQHPDFVSWSLGVLVGMFNSKPFNQQRHNSVELRFSQVNSKLFRFIPILT